MKLFWWYVLFDMLIAGILFTFFDVDYVVEKYDTYIYMILGLALLLWKVWKAYKNTKLRKLPAIPIQFIEG